MVLCIATILLCTVLSILIYCHEREGKRVYGIASGRRIAVCSLSGKHVSIFAHEGYKFYVLGGMGVFLIVAAVVSMRMAEGIPSHTGTTEIQAYRYYIEQLQGTYTEETRAWLEQETQIMQMTALQSTAGVSPSSLCMSPKKFLCFEIAPEFQMPLDRSRGF